MTTADQSRPGAGIFMLGVGAQKAGTTWLHRYLSSHDEVYLSPIKEMHFFDEMYLTELVGKLPAHYYLGWLEKNIAGIIKKGQGSDPELRMAHDLIDRVAMKGNIERYFEFFRKRSEGKAVCGEITPSYSMLSAEHLATIRKAHPDVRPIFIMREPVERYWSAMRMIERENSGSRASELATRHLGNRQHMARGRYDLTLKALQEVFGKDGFLALFYEELFRDDTIRSICDFLSISFRQADFGQRHNASPVNEDLPTELHETIRAAFSEVYEGVEQYMGRLPAEWRHGPRGA